MRVSMLALLRLSGYAFLLGALLLAAYVLLRLVARLFFVLLPRRHTEKPHSRIRRCLSAAALGELLFSLLSAAALAILLYWQGDGIPRLFVFLSAALGALALKRLLGGVWSSLEAWLLAAFQRFSMRILRPILSFFRRIGRFLLFFLRKTGGGMIKCAKGIYTNGVSARYRGRARHRARDRRLAARLREALRQEDEYDGYGA